MTHSSTVPVSRRSLMLPPLLDIACMLLLLVTGVIAFGPVFSGAPGYVAAAGGVAIGSTIGVVSAWRSWSLLGTVTSGGVCYLTFGGVLALPSTTVAGFVPSVETLQRLVLLTYQAWRDLLTVSVPASSFTGPAVVPYLAGIICSLLAMTAALRMRNHLWALAPTMSLLLIGILWGTKNAPTAALEGAIFTITALGWAAWRATRKQQRDTAALLTKRPSNVTAARQRTIAGLAILGLVGGFGLLGGTSIAAESGRYVLRDEVVPPLDLHDYPSPLTRYRYYEHQLKNKRLMTVDGLPEDGRVRLAALDSYDGNVYNVDRASADFVRVGEEIGSGDRVGLTTLDVKIDKYSGVWLPGGGDLRRVDFSGKRADALAEGLHFNDDTGTALTTPRLTSGDAYQVQVDMSAPPADAALVADSIADVSMGSTDNVPEEISAEAPNFGRPAASQIKQLRQIEAKFQSVGFYSNNEKISSAGHYTRRLGSMFSGLKMIGDDEQYASAMALMVRQLGYPARVVLGFYPEKYREGPIEITGNDAHVWVEVPFRDAGWVRFDPTPDRDKKPNTKVPQPKERPQPQVLPPPEPPHERVDPPKDETDQANNRDEDLLIPQAVRVLAYILGGGILLATPFLLIAGAKSRRRTRRRNHGSTAYRIDGGWSELMDATTDWGVATRRRVTRQETAGDLQTEFPGSSPVMLARQIDAKVFGLGNPTDDDVAEMWRQVDEVLAGMRGSMSRWRRVRGSVSMKSFYRGKWRLRLGEIGKAAGDAATAVVTRLRGRAPSKGGTHGPHR